jgi:hypothetical protein
MAYTDIDDPSAFFQTALYTSTGSALSVVNTGNSDLQPDLIWIKSRSEGQLNCLFNSSHTGEFLSSNLVAASDTSAGGVTSYNTDGFSIGTLGGINNGTNTHVAWQWKTGTAFSNDASSTSVGSIDSTGSVNTTSGFSIISYTGNGSANQSVAHGLGATPKIILIKNRTTAGYWCMTNPRFVSVSDPNILYLQITAAEADDTNINGTTAPSSTVFGVDDYGAVNTSGNAHIAYCFTPIKGYSSMGTYVGNASTNGTFVYTGMKPAWVMFRKAAGTGSWAIQDNKRTPFNVQQKALFANLADAESNSADNNVDFLSNGFKLKSDTANYNTNGDTYIYLAFAESPFVTSTGIPATAR